MNLSDDEYRDHVSRLRSAINAAPSSAYSHVAHAGTVNGYTPERSAAHEAILDDAWAELGGDDIPKGRQGLILGGTPGSGKTSVRSTATVPGVGPVQGGFLPIDSDYFKGKLIDAGLAPSLRGFSPMEAAPLMHKESNDIAKKFARRAYDQGTNLAWDYTLRHSTSGPNRLKEFGRYDYTPHGIYVHANPQDSLARVSSRHRDDLGQYMEGLHRHGGRYVPPEIITDSVHGTRIANRDNYDAIAPRLASSQIFNTSARTANADLRFQHYDDPQYPATTAHLGDERVGLLRWYPESGTVRSLDVEPEHQRKGIASALVNWTRANAAPHLQPSPVQTDMGKGFAGGYKQANNWMQQILQDHRGNRPIESIGEIPVDANYFLDQGDPHTAWVLQKEKQHGKPLSQFTEDDWAIAGSPPTRQATRRMRAAYDDLPPLPDDFHVPDSPEGQPDRSPGWLHRQFVGPHKSVWDIPEHELDDRWNNVYDTLGFDPKTREQWESGRHTGDPSDKWDGGMDGTLGGGVKDYLTRAPMSKDEYARHREDSQNRAKKMADGLWGAMYPPEEEEGRKAVQNTETINGLLDNGWQPEHIKYDEDDEPYAYYQHPSGWNISDYGGMYKEIGHAATPGESHDVINTSRNIDGQDYREPFGPADAHAHIENQLHGDPEETGGMFQYLTENDPRIKKYKPRLAHRTWNQYLGWVNRLAMPAPKPRAALTVQMPTESAWHYRQLDPMPRQQNDDEGNWGEGDNDGWSDWGAGDEGWPYSSLRSSVSQSGVTEPLTLHTDGTHALLEDGNHRAGVAHELRVPTVPVRIHHMPMVPGGTPLEPWMRQWHVDNLGSGAHRLAAHEHVESGQKGRPDWTGCAHPECRSDLPTTMYHSTHKNNRDSIAQNGLLASYTQDDELSDELGMPHGIYMTADLPKRGPYTMNDDVWAIDTSKLQHLENDYPKGLMARNSFCTKYDIPPHAMRLIDNAKRPSWLDTPMKKIRVEDTPKDHTASRTAAEPTGEHLREQRKGDPDWDRFYESAPAWKAPETDFGLFADQDSVNHYNTTHDTTQNTRPAVREPYDGEFEGEMPYLSDDRSHFLYRDHSLYEQPQWAMLKRHEMNPHQGLYASRTAGLSDQPDDVTGDYSMAEFFQWCAHNHKDADRDSLAQYAAVSGMDTEDYLDIYLFLSDDDEGFR